MKREEQLTRLGIHLPAAAAPQAMYVPSCRTGSLLFVSGQIPVVDGTLQYTGRVGDDVDFADAERAARLCAINVIAAARDALGDLDRVRRVVKITVFVNSADTFNRQHLVANAASQLLFDVFGEDGRHTRSAVGVNALPMDAPVEIEAVIEVR